MDEALILQKLDNLSNEIRSLKSGVLEELRQELMPVIKQAGPLVTDCLSELDDGHTREDFTLLAKNLLANVEMLNSLLSTVKGAMELKGEIEPVAKLVLPRATELFSQLEGQFDTEEFTALMRNTLTNLHHFNTAITLLKAGMELKDEIEPIAKLMLPRMIEFIDEVGGGYDQEQVKVLIRNTMSNLENFNTALGMLKAGMEFKNDIEPLAKVMLPRAISFFAEIGGLLKVTGTALESIKNMPCTPEQAEAMSEVIRQIDLGKTNRIGPIKAMKKLNDPKVQEALGATFTMLEVIGSLLDAYRNSNQK